MWPWQQKKVPKKVKFFGHLFFCISLFHAFFLFIGFVVYRGSISTFNVSISKTLLSPSAKIVYVPLFKVAPKKEIKTSIDADHIKRELIKENNNLKNKSTLPEKLKETNKPKTAIVTKSVLKKKLQEIKKPKQIEQVAKAVPSKVNKNPVKKEPPKKMVKKQPKQKELIAKNDENIYLGRSQLNTFRMQQYLQKEVTKKWQPPIGLPSDLHCEIAVSIGMHGKIKKVVVKATSGVLAYDISAQSALSCLRSFPDWAKGKEFCITFKQ